MTRRRRLIRTLVVLGVVAVAVGVAVALLVDSGGDSTHKVTLADNGTEVTVVADQPFVVELKGSEDSPWDLPQASEESVARIFTSQELDGSATARFIPLDVSPGGMVSAERVVPCAGTADPCPRKTERFEITLRVVR